MGNPSIVFVNFHAAHKYKVNEKARLIKRKPYVKMFSIEEQQSSSE